MPHYSKRRALTVEEKNSLASYSDLTSQLLFHRGLTSEGVAAKFLMPEYERDTHDPLLLKDSMKASMRIITAIEKGQKIAIYADYDCDGIPGAAMFHDLFSRIGFKNFVTYIPHRHNEGFGLNEGAVLELVNQGVQVLVTVDCGISDKDAVGLAMKNGIDVIVTDHHEPPDELPPAFAVIDPRQKDCQYPDKNLCGTGVGFKFIQAILSLNRFGLKVGHEKWLLDLVGIATLSDMVPLHGENRVFAHYGLQVLRKSPRKGLRQLLSKLRISQPHLTEDDIAFMITPRINAASRMGVPMDAFNLLVADNDEDADKHADHLDKINNERKGVVASLVKEVKKIVRERHSSAIPNVIVLGNPSWRPALLGLAANSCVEEFRRPVFLWGRDGEGFIKGSCRGDGTTHVVELMKAVPAGIFTEYGGHKHSGGFAVSNDAVHYLEERLNESAQLLANIAANGNVPDEENLIDAELSINDVSSKLFDEINRLAPFGVGNRKPVFLIKNVFPASIRIFGKTNEHVEVNLVRDDSSKVSAISFFGAGEEWAQRIKPQVPFDLVASIERSMFMNRPQLRLRIVDVINS